MMKEEHKSKKLNVKNIIADQEICPRIMIDSYHVAELTKLINEKVKLKAVTVYKDKKKNEYYLVDGFHRLEAHKRAGKAIIWCNISSGSYRDAYVDACEANAYHGKRLTNEDKLRIVTRLLKDKKESVWSDCSIAKKCGVSQPFVSIVREKLKSQNGYEFSDKRKAANGTIVDTSNIGKSKKGKNDVNGDNSKQKPRKITERDYQKGWKKLSELQEKLNEIETLLKERTNWKSKSIKALKQANKETGLAWEKFSEFLTMIQEYL